MLEKRQLQRRCFLVKFAKYLRTPLLLEQLHWLLLRDIIPEFQRERYSSRDIIPSFLNFAMTKCFCRNMFCQDIFIIKKLFYNVVQTAYQKSGTRDPYVGSRTRDLSPGTRDLYVGCGTWDPGPYMWEPGPDTFTWNAGPILRNSYLNTTFS